MKIFPKLGQQVYVQYLDIYLVPVTFVGWCISHASLSFTLTDGYSRRQFLITSPMVLIVSQLSLSEVVHYSKPLNKKQYYENRARSVELLRELETFHDLEM